MTDDLVLKKCPFCGEYPENGVYLDENDYIVFRIKCRRCDYSFTHSIYMKPNTIEDFFKRTETKIEELVTHWNTRFDSE